MDGVGSILGTGVEGAADRPRGLISNLFSAIKRSVYRERFEGRSSSTSASNTKTVALGSSLSPS